MPPITLPSLLPISIFTLIAWRIINPIPTSSSASSKTPTKHHRHHSRTPSIFWTTKLSGAPEAAAIVRGSPTTGRVGQGGTEVMVRKEWNPRSGGTGFGSLGAQVGVGIVTGVGHRNAPKGKGVKGHRRTRSTPASLGKGQGSAGLGRWRRGSGGAGGSGGRRGVGAGWGRGA